MALAVYAQPNSINVRLYGGTAPFMNSQWNNWNVGTAAFQTPITSNVFNYSDGSPSSIYASLSIQSALYDNASGYGQNASMCPDSVLRYVSYITSTRTLTIKGLDNSSKYNIELYASRGGTTGQITKFAIGSQSINVATDNNTSNSAAFPSIPPSNGSIVVTISRVVTYNFLNGFKITRITSVTPPAVNAGVNQIITIPASSVTLTGTALAGSSAIYSTTWSQLSGPSEANIQNPGTLVTPVSNLVQGIYIFKLLAIDINGLKDSSSVTVTVNAVPVINNSSINVRLYGGTAPYMNGQWNNWNVGTAAFQTPVTSAAFNYSDGSPSGIYASLSLQSALYDNTAGYGQNASMCPDSVLRFASYITSSRTLTIRGLDNASKYNIELYASRAGTSGQITKFTLGIQSLTIATDNNTANVAAFSSIVPSNGSISISLSRLVTYNFLNGFKITRVSSNAPPTVNAGTNQIIKIPASSVMLSGTVIPGNSQVVSTNWIMVSGPNTATIQNPSSLNTSVSNLVQGIYIFKLLAVDGNNFRDSSAISVIVNPAKNTNKHIVLLGSSTAAGFFNGLWPIDSSYALQLQRYYQQAGIADTVYILASNSANPYMAMPSWFTPDNSLQPVSTYTYDPNRNITRALTLHPDVILCHFPTNNFDVLTMTQIMFAFRTIKATADSAGVPLYFIGTQPRGNLSIDNKQKMIAVNDSLLAAFGPHSISYYDSVAIAPRALNMNPVLWLDNDSIHMNPQGHDIIFRQIIKTNLFSIMSGVIAGSDQSIRLPLDSILLNGLITMGSNPIISTSWSQLSGPSAAVIYSPGSLSTQVSGLMGGLYVFQLSVIDSLGGSSSSTVKINVLPYLPPTVNAGENQSIFSPLSSAALSGTVTKGGGTVVSTLWSQQSGPSTATVESPDSLNTPVSGLMAGTYLFVLTATDSIGISAYDSVFVTVTSGQSINVRLYGGIAPFMNSQWNNWNIGTAAFQTPATSGLFKNADGTSSTVSASLTIQGGLSDNGATYTHGATMCPDSALRFTSYITSTRKLTISGLDNASKYNLELYASKISTSGQITKFLVGTQSINISTDNNNAGAAVFSALSPTGGNIVVTISRVVTYNYINGFKLTRVSSGSNLRTSGNIDALNIQMFPDSVTNDKLKVQIFPNPVTNDLNIITNGNSPMQIEIFDITGRKMISYVERVSTHQVNMSGLKNGSYVLAITNKQTGEIIRKVIIKI